ncbi:MAG: RdgB/HAM1 family non-canonical purine NTP pyrophosphatase [Bacteroidales bacterium]|nr:RdgB/HAM1 family non-canonical purine NTP pyrophosphatase [Bacteroidales bacterium]
MKFVCATNNSHKISEIEKIIGNNYQLVSLKEIGITEDIPEEENTFEGNALAKARYVFQKTGMNVFADDSGLEVEALNNQPGVHSARYSGNEKNYKENNRLLLKNMEGVTNREARFRTVIALILDGKEYIFDGIIEGSISYKPRGSGGFGYDPLFVPENQKLTFAEMSISEKNKISHRSRAITKLTRFLNTNTRQYN